MRVGPFVRHTSVFVLLTACSSILSPSPLRSGAPQAAHAASADEAAFEAASSSKIASIGLPKGGARLKDAATIRQLFGPVEKMARLVDKEVSEPEVIGWSFDGGGMADGIKVRETVKATLEKAGYLIAGLDTGGPEGFPRGISMFSAWKDKRPQFMGYWMHVEDGKGLVLCWGRAANVGVPSAVTAAAPAAAAKAPSTSGKVPAALLGKWRRTALTSSAGYYVSDGSYAGRSGIDGAQIYHFFPDGTYKFWNYVKSSNYAVKSEYFTFEKGTAVAQGDRLSLKPTGGDFEVRGTGRGDYKRPYSEADKAKRARTLLWTKDGAKVKFGEKPGDLMDFNKIE